METFIIILVVLWATYAGVKDLNDKSKYRGWK